MADYTTIRGKRCCTCVASWFPVFEQLAQARGLVSGPIWLIQATGSAPASAGTHAQGGAMDIGVMSHDLVRLAREMGASASWVRNTGAFAANQHSHLVLEGCPHNAPARYQISAVHSGYDGLGYAGRAGRDPEWRPPQWRTWTQGIDWARQQLPTPTQEDIDVSDRIYNTSTDQRQIGANTSLDLQELLRADGKTRTAQGSFRLNASGAGRVEIVKLDGDKTRDLGPIGAAPLAGAGLTTVVPWQTWLSGSERVVARVYAYDDVLVSQTVCDLNQAVR